MDLVDYLVVIVVIAITATAIAIALDLLKARRPVRLDAPIYSKQEHTVPIDRITRDPRDGYRHEDA